MSLHSYSQDIIILKNGNENKAKVTEIGLNDIKYKDYSNLTGPTYTISKSKVFLIRYENGKKDVFTEIKENNKQTKVEKVYPNKFGFKLGLLSSGIYGDAENAEAKGSVYAGILYEKAINKNIGIQTELVFNRLGAKIKDSDNYVNYDYLTIPLNMNFYTSRHFNFHVGLQGGIMLSAKAKSEKNDNVNLDIKSETNSIDLGSNFGFDINPSEHFSINFNIYVGFMEVIKNFDQKNIAGQIGISYKL